MMKRLLLLTVMLAGLISLGVCCFSKCAAAASAASTGDDWKLCMKTYTYYLKPIDLDFFQSLDKTRELGIKYVEAFPGQRIGGGMSGTMDFKVDAATREKILAKCNEAGIKIVGYGVARPKTDAECRQLFDYCKAMGVEYIVMEPEPGQLALLDKLCNEYKIDVAIHNHPKADAPYRDPETVLKAIAGRSKRMGACADTGHWARAGFVPVECLKKLDGRVIMLHFKDLNEKGNINAHDVVWGSGVCDVPGIMAELRRQGFKGYFSIEYEYPATTLENLPKCVEYFNRVKGMSESELKAMSAAAK